VATAEVENVVKGKVWPRKAACGEDPTRFSPHWLTHYMASCESHPLEDGSLRRWYLKCDVKPSGTEKEGDPTVLQV
jgi:hypothetical protein